MWAGKDENTSKIKYPLVLCSLLFATHLLQREKNKYTCLKDQLTLTQVQTG